MASAPSPLERVGVSFINDGESSTGLVRQSIIKTYFKFTPNMNITITVRGKNVRVYIREHVTRITNDDELNTLLANDTEAATRELITGLKARYCKEFGREFNVSDASIAVEIWGHVYVEKFAMAMSSLKFTRKLAAIIIRHCKIIDIGERGHDHNLFVWDALSVFKKPIALLMARKN